MYIVVGLGNPGRRFANTRHNLGFITIDQLAKKLGISVTRSRFQALIGEGMIGGEKVLLAKPQTYMNLSGQSVNQIVSYFKVPMDHLILIYDDMDLPVGTLRIRKQGSAGTHKGMQSVIYSLQKDDFPRMRIGIGSHGDQEVKSYVTGGFTREEVAPLEDAVTRAVEAVILTVEEGIEPAMNRYNGSSS